MWKKVKIILVIMGIILQMLMVVVFGFAEASVSPSKCFFAFTICGILIQHFLHPSHVH